jgi:hypothetical protein
MSSTFSSLLYGNRMDPALDTTYTSAGREVVGSYGTYQEAQRAVDHLADARFPVEFTDIVGRDVQLVERVTGRMTTARAAAAGAGTGAWFGLFIGVLIGLFTPGAAWLGLILGGLLIGALWGATFGFVTQWPMRGERDFASARELVASSYEVSVVDAYADRARELLVR